MKKIINPYVGLLLFAALSFCSFSCGESSEPKPNPEQTEESIDLNNLRREIAAMIMTAFDGPTLNHNSKIYKDISERGIGGVIIYEYKKNIASPEQLKKLCSDLQEAAGGKLIISIDQEGGRVNRLKSKYGFPEFPSAKVLGDAEDSETQLWSDLCATALSDAGINLNFAPVVDVNVNPSCPAIGALDRSFSADPEKVTSKAEIWIDAHTSKNVMSCLKHFPGHGSSTADSHEGNVDITNTWTDIELIPYRKLIGADKAPMIMVGHIFNANIDPEYPASLSKKTIENLLREELGYDGVVITDDLGMGAIVNNYSYDKIVELAINAGVDMLCISNGPAEYSADFVGYTIELIVRKVMEKRISPERIHQAYVRISKLKDKI